MNINLKYLNHTGLSFENSTIELYDWLDTIPLTRTRRNLARDFSDGVLVAEIIYHLRPQWIDLYNYIPANGKMQKRRNWILLNSRVFSKKFKFKLRDIDINNLVDANKETIENLLFLIRNCLSTNTIINSINNHITPLHFRDSYPISSKKKITDYLYTTYDYPYKSNISKYKETECLNDYSEDSELTEEERMPTKSKNYQSNKKYPIDGSKQNYRLKKNSNLSNSISMEEFQRNNNSKVEEDFYYEEDYTNTSTDSILSLTSSEGLQDVTVAFSENKELEDNNNKLKNKYSTLENSESIGEESPEENYLQTQNLVKEINKLNNKIYNMEVLLHKKDLKIIHLVKRIHDEFNYN